ncbi:MAG: MarR family winged helix-turn-helix transcriptional regulator [bacterium]
MIEALEKLGKLRRQLSQTFISFLKPLGIAPRQAILLRYLSVQGSSSLADLARRTVTDPATVTRTVNLLLKKGFLRRAGHATDRRRLEVSLTPEGKKLAEKVDRVYARTAERMVSPLANAERHNLIRLLDKILNASGSGETEKGADR